MGSKRLLSQQSVSCTLSFTAASITLAYSTLTARLRDKCSFLCSTLKTASRATLSAENQPCAANIARFIVIQSESRKETDVALTACCSLHIGTDLKSHHQSQWISTVPAQTDLSCMGMDFSLNSPWLSYNEHHLRPGAGHYCQNKTITLYFPIAVMHPNRAELISYALHQRKEQFRFRVLCDPSFLC